VRLLDIVSPALTAASRVLDTRPTGRRKVPGLRSDVEVYFTTGGIPHLYAAAEEDLFFAQGYLCANERLFQMDFMRHAASGRLSEIFGERPIAWRDLTVHLKGRTTVDLDHFVRLLGLRQAARKSLAIASRRALLWLHAYARGVNARIAEKRFPLEFKLLRHRPEPWTPEDSLLVEKAVALEMNVAWRAILVHTALAARVKDPKRLAALLPAYPADAEPIVRPDAAQLAALATALGKHTGVGGPHAGSNNWVVAGTHTDSGSPYLCSDPHTQLTAPAAFFIAHLSGDGLDVAGAAIPGVPGIVLGHNRDIAWGATICVAHDTDLFIEELDATGTRCRTPDGYAELLTRDEEIRVRGRATPVLRHVRSSRHGPLLTDLLPGESGVHLAMSWTALDATGEIDALVGMAHARDFASFRAAVAHHGAPALNMVYADREGHVAYQCSGAFPLRKGTPRYLPSPGWTGESDWTGRVPFEALPWGLDPERGFIATANNRIVPADCHVYLSGLYEPPHRHRRICELLAARDRHRLADMAHIQADTHSLWAQDIIDGVLKPLARAKLPMSPETRATLERLVGWDCDSRPASTEAVVFYAFYFSLTRRLLFDELGEDLFAGYFEIINTSVVPLENLLIGTDSPWGSPEARDQAAANALQDALDELTSKLGPDQREWRWGRLHTLSLRHRLHEVQALRPLLSPGPVETGGDGMTVNNGQFWFSHPAEHMLGAAYRQIFDLADWDRARVVLAGGESGDPLSPRYRDLFAIWQAGGYVELPFSRRKVTEVGERAVLTP
jgi:penicillin G amidase